jgi:ADP-ribosyltransferase exoenzyme
VAPLAVDPAALDGAGRSLADVGKGIGLTLSTLTGTLSGCGGMCGDDPVGEAMGQAYDSTATGLVTAIAVSRNGLVNLGDGVRMSAHNYSLAEAQSDVGGRAESLPVPAASGAITASAPPSAVGGGLPAPPGFGWVSKYIGMIWPTADSAQLRTAAGAWIVVGTDLLVTQTSAAGALGVIGTQQIPDAAMMGQAFSASLNAATQVMAQVTAVAAQLTSYADKVDAVHAAIVDLLARICDPLTGFKVVWDFLTDDEESEIKEIAQDIKTVVDNFSAEVSALATELRPMVNAAGVIAETMATYADKEWEQFLQGSAVGRQLDEVAQAVKGFGLQGWELLEGSWTYSPQRAVLDPDGVFDDYKNLVTGMAPLVGMDEDGWTGTGDAWKEVGKETVHWDVWKTNPAEAFGRSLFDIATMFVPGGAASKAGKVGHDAAEVAEGAVRATPTLPELTRAPESPRIPDPPSPAPEVAPAPNSVEPTAAAKPGAPVTAPTSTPDNLGPTEHKPLAVASDTGLSARDTAVPPASGAPHSGGGSDGPSNDGGAPDGGSDKNNPPHTALTDPPANTAPPGSSFPDISEINEEFRLPSGEIDPARFGEWAAKVSEAYPGLSKENVEAIYDYTTQNYEAVNTYLRDINPLSDAQQSGLGAKSIAEMTAAQRSTLEEQIARTDEGLASLPPYRFDQAETISTTWRGLRAPDMMVQQLEVGKIFSDTGYLSTSTDSFVAEAFARGAGSGESPVVLTVEGRNGVDVAQLSQFVDEAEILFPRGSNFEVISAQPDQDGIIRIVIRQVED